MTVRKQLALLAVIETNNAALFAVFAQHFAREEASRSFMVLAILLVVCGVLRAVTAMVKIHTKNIDDDIARVLGYDIHQTCEACGRTKI